MLAGVSVDYLTRLEQGRDLNPSTSVVHALANALRLNADERIYLKKLTMVGNTPELCPGSTTMVTQIAPNVQSIIDALDPTPAFITGPASHLLAGNESWRTLVEPLGMLDEDPPNLATYVFTNPRSRDVLTEWSRSADEQVAQLRASSVRWGHDPAFATMIDELHAVPEFAERWSTHSVSVKHRGIKLLRHPDVGELRLRFETLDLPNDGDQRLTTWFPADETTEAALRQAIRRGPLRVARPA